MSNEARLKLVIDALYQAQSELKELKNDLGDVDDKTKKTAGSMGDLKQGLGGAIENATGLSLSSISLAGAIGLVGTGLKLAIDAALENQQAMAQTEAVIRATGGAAGMTAEEVASLADALEMQTTVSAETIQSGENMLLTFKNVGEETFPRATTAMLDMAVAMAQGDTSAVDLKGTAIQLGKALNDPIEGMSALSRVGVTFTEEQKAMIEAMVEAGDVAGAQGVILAELESEFGGAAEAAGSVGREFKTLQIVGGNFLESAGLRLLPWLEDAASGFLNLVKTVVAANLAYMQMVGTISNEEASTRAAALANNDLGTAIFGTTTATDSLVTATEGATTATAAFTGEIITAEEAEKRHKAELAANEAAVRSLTSLMQGAVGNELDGFAKKQTELKEKGEELRAKIAELEGRQYLTGAQKQQLSDLRTELDENNSALDTNAAKHEEAMKRIVFSILQQQAAVDGFTTQEVTALTTVAQKWGLIDEATATATQQVSGALAGLANDGNLPLFMSRLDTLDKQLRGIPTEISVHIAVTESNNSSFAQVNRTGAPIPQAEGGVQHAGGYYWVGERGPEPVFPAVDGRVISHSDAMNALRGGASGGGSGGDVYHIAIDARGALDPSAVEEAGYRGAQRALAEAGRQSEARGSTRAYADY